jgi:hypothetical protein
MKCPNCYALEGELFTLKEKLAGLESNNEKVVVLDSWKGKDRIEIEKSQKGWRVIEHRKDKTSQEVKPINHYIPDKNVEQVFTIIKQYLILKDKVSPRDIWEQLIFLNNLQIDINSFNGGDNRGMYHMHYYFPVKILEKLKKIDYSGRGIITKGLKYGTD